MPMRPTYQPGRGMHLPRGTTVDSGVGYFIPPGFHHAVRDEINVQSAGSPPPVRDLPTTIVRQLFGGRLHPPQR